MITDDEIFSIFQNTLTLMLDLEAELVDSKQNVAPHDVTGCVQISGEWQGAVVVQSTDELAKLFASRLFAADANDLNEEELRDAFAELTNMIGGNIKCQVPSPSFLSIPSVTIGSNYDFRLVGAKVVRDIVTICNNQPCRIMVWNYVSKPCAV